jgi:hypothetical protein
MRESESRIGSAVAVRLQADCKRNPAFASELPQVVELEGEAPTVETHERKVAALRSLTDPARRAAEPIGSLFEVEQVPRLSGRRRWKLSGELGCESRRQLLGKCGHELLGQVRGENGHGPARLARASFPENPLPASATVAAPGDEAPIKAANALV